MTEEPQFEVPEFQLNFIEVAEVVEAFLANKVGASVQTEFTHLSFLRLQFTDS